MTFSILIDVCVCVCLCFLILYIIRLFMFNDVFSFLYFFKYREPSATGHAFTSNPSVP